MATVLEQTFDVIRDDYANAGKVSSLVKDTLKQLGIPASVLRRIAVACYEAEINMIIHAYGGLVILIVNDDGTIELHFNDLGPGIEDIEKAMTPGYSTASEEARSMGFGAGMGLPNIKRVSDSFEIVSGPEGTNMKLTFKANE